LWITRFESIYSWVDWIFELSDYFLNNDILADYEFEELFTIHINPNNQILLDNIKRKKYKNPELINIDNFTWNKNISWSFVWWKNVSHFLSEIWYIINYPLGFLWNCLDLKWNNCNLYLTINYLDNNDFLIIRYNNKDLSLSLLDKIRLLLWNSEILEFSIIENPYKIDKWIYETKIKITFEEIIKIKDNGIQNWQIDFSNNWNKIKWIVDENIVFLTKSLFCDYFDIVNTKIENYLPISNRDDYVNITKAKEECYVYLMHDTINWYHKIWISNKPEYREKTLQSEKPSIAMITNKKFPNRDIALAFEQALHRTYQEKRIRWEWLNLDEFELNDLKFVIKD